MMDMKTNKIFITANLCIVLGLIIPVTRKIVIPFCFLYMYIVFIAIVLNTFNLKKHIQTLSRNDKVISVILLFCSFLSTYAVISKNKFIYFWDYSGYWIMTDKFTNMLFSSPKNGLLELYHSIRYNDYNLLLSSILAVPIRIFGESYLSYTLALHLVYFIPAVIILIAIVYSTLDKIDIDKKPQIWMIIFLIIGYHGLLVPMYDGYYDIGAVVFSLLVIYIIVNFDISNYSKKQVIVLMVSVVFTYLSRRYFTFFLISIFLVYSIFVMFKYGIKKFIFKYVKLVSIMLTIITVFLVMSVLPILKHEFLYNYSEKYSAYSLGFLKNIYASINSVGIYTIVFVIALCLIIVVVNKRFFPYIFLLIGHICLVIFLFSYIQQMNIQHQYLIQIPLLIILILIFSFLYNKIYNANKTREKYLYIVLLIVFFTWYSLDFISTFCIINKPYFKGFSSARYTAKIRNDIGTMQRFAHVLLDMRDKKVFVIASSQVFNRDILEKAYYPYEVSHPYEHPNNLLYNADVDLRDGFPLDFFKADIIVLADPVQYHLKPSDQHVIGILSDAITSKDSLLNKKYNLLFTEQIDNGVLIKVYERVIDLDQNDVLYLEHKFDKVYPQYPEIFHDRLDNYKKNNMHN